MHPSLQIMFILSLMTGQLFWKGTILGGLYRDSAVYTYMYVYIVLIALTHKKETS